MTDPKRLLQASGSIEARVLAAGLHHPTPIGLEDRAWQDFVARVGPLAGVSAASASRAANTSGPVGHAPATTVVSVTQHAAVLGVAKMVSLGALVGLSAMGASYLLGSEATDQRPPSAPATLPRGPLARPMSSAESAVVHPPIAADSSAPSTSTRGFMTAVPFSTPASAAPSRSASVAHNQAATLDAPPLTGSPAIAAFPEPRRAADSKPVSAGGTGLPLVSPIELKAEATELAQAKNLLQGGQAREALAKLTESEQRFARGMLNQERELLTVQVLMALGQRAEATQRARTFLASHANLPISARMRRLVGVE